MQQVLIPEDTRQAIVDREGLAYALKAAHVALDIETETRWPGTGPKKDYGLSYCAEPLYISLAWRESGHDGQPEGLRATVLGAPFDEETRAALRQLVDGSHTVIMHNAVFDARALSRLIGGATPENIWCTATMARLLHPVNNGSYNLVAVAAQLSVETSKEQREMKGERKNLHKLPVAQVIAYAMEDALVTCLISEKQMALVDQQVLGDEGRTYFLADWECRAVREYCRMAAQGMKLNVPYVQQRVLELHETVKGTAARLKADGLANPGSTQQRAEYIYGRKGIPRPDPELNASYYTAGGNLSTSAGVIEALLEQFPEHKDKLADLVTHLGVDRMMATQESLLEHAAIDGRIHSLVSIGTDTGRRSASHPQTQNWKMTAEDSDIAGDMCGVVCGADGFTPGRGRPPGR
jgi:DNA polymerase I-like protein with 3'-5' exonuclease and polymerase domains